MEKIYSLIEKIKELSRNDQLTFDLFHTEFYEESDLDRDEYRERIKNHTSVYVDDALLDYLFIAGTEMDWTNEKILSDANSYLYGSFFMNDIFVPIVAPSTFWEPYNMSFKDEVEKKDLLRLNYFQRSAHGDDGTFGCFYRHPLEYFFPIYFYDNGIYFPMTVDLDEYYEAMLFCKAVVLWQYFYVEPIQIVRRLQGYQCSDWISLYEGMEGNPSRIEGLLHHFDVLIKQFPILFPEFDVSFITEKKDAVEKEYRNYLE